MFRLLRSLFSGPSPRVLPRWPYRRQCGSLRLSEEGQRPDVMKLNVATEVSHALGPEGRAANDTADFVRTVEGS